MQRPQRRFRRRNGAGAGRGAPQPQPNSQQPVDSGQNVFFQNQAPYAQFPPHSHPFNPYFQNPNLQYQQLASSGRPNLLTPTPQQNRNLPARNQSPVFPTQWQNQQPNLVPGNVASSSTAGEFPRPHSSIPRQNPNHAGQNQTQHQPQQQGLLSERRETLERIDVAVQQVRRDLIASAENVSTWIVSQLALVKLKAESWDSLGVQLQRVSSFKSLIRLEGKINTFIQCFVAVRTVTSLYDMEVAICKNEGIGNFEELELGPLVRHPLIEHYFSSKDMTEIYKITGEDIISYLKMFIIKAKGKSFQGDEFLDFVAQMCRVRWEKMGLRILQIGSVRTSHLVHSHSKQGLWAKV